MRHFLSILQGWDVQLHGMLMLPMAKRSREVWVILFSLRAFRNISLIFKVIKKETILEFQIIFISLFFSSDSLLKDPGLSVFSLLVFSSKVRHSSYRKGICSVFLLINKMAREDFRLPSYHMVIWYSYQFGEKEGEAITEMLMLRHSWCLIGIMS